MSSQKYIFAKEVFAILGHDEISTRKFYSTLTVLLGLRDLVIKERPGILYSLYILFF